MSIQLEWDAIDNRNLALLRQIIRDAGQSHDEHWQSGLLNAVLYAMRRAGDDAMKDQVTVRLERAFGSTHDIREGATLATDTARRAGKPYG